MVPRALQGLVADCLWQGREEPQNAFIRSTGQAAKTGTPAHRLRVTVRLPVGTVEKIQQLWQLEKAKEAWESWQGRGGGRRKVRCTVPTASTHRPWARESARWTHRLHYPPE